MCLYTSGTDVYVCTSLMTPFLFMRGPGSRSKRVFNTLPDDKILDWSDLKQIADDILKCI